MPITSGLNHLPTDRFVRIVHVTVDAEIEDEWNEWYDNVHVPDICNCPGYVAVRRFRVPNDGEPEYLSIYEVTDPNAHATPEVAKVAGWGPYEGRVRNVHPSASYEETSRYLTPSKLEQIPFEPATTFDPSSSDD